MAGLEVPWKLKVSREFPGGPVDRIWRFHCRGPVSIPGQGTEIPQAAWRGQKTKDF